jgi:hypothetical protein
MPRKRASTPFLREHSLSLTLAGILIFLFLMYRRSDPSTHLGALYGNAIADWLGVLVFVIAPSTSSKSDREKAGGRPSTSTSASPAS